MSVVLLLPRECQEMMRTRVLCSNTTRTAPIAMNSKQQKQPNSWLLQDNLRDERPRGDATGSDINDTWLQHSAKPSIDSTKNRLKALIA
jgi:hypothetical protein